MFIIRNKIGIKIHFFSISEGSSGAEKVPGKNSGHLAAAKPEA